MLPSVMETIKTYIKTLLSEQLKIDKQNIFYFNQNDIVTPLNKQYIIIQILDTTMQSTNVEDLQNGIIYNLLGVRIQIDFYGADAFFNAIRMYTLFNSAYLQTDMRIHGFSVVEFETPINLTGVDFSDQYLIRYSLSGEIEIINSDNIILEYFDDADIKTIQIQ